MSNEVIITEDSRSSSEEPTTLVMIECPCCEAEILFDTETFDYTSIPPNEVEPSHPNIAPYRDNSTWIPGDEQTDERGVVRKVNTPVTQRESGLRVETMISDPNPKRNVKPSNRHVATMTPLTATTPFKPKRGRAIAVDENFEVQGEDASQDFTGLTGAEGHFDALLQQAYEEDLSDRGFSY